MTARLSGRLGNWFVLLFLGAALLLLQMSNAADGLVANLPAYALIGIAALIAFGARRLSPGTNLVCFGFAGIFVSYVVVRSLASPFSYSARSDLYLVLAAFAVYALAAVVLSRSLHRVALFIVLLVFAVGHVLVELVQFGLGENFTIPFLQTFAVMGRPSGLYGNPNHLAGLLEILSIFALSIACWSRLPGWIRVLVGYLGLTCYIGLALTASRGGYISAAVSLAVFAFLGFIVLRADSALLRTYGAIGLIVAAVAFFGGRHFIYQSPSLHQRLTNLTTADTGRLEMWRASIEQWKLQPLIGTGGGTYLFYGRQFRAEEVQADPVYVHNDYLHLLCEYGVLGAAAFLLFLGAHLHHGVRTFLHFGPHRLAAGALALSDRLALNIGALCTMAAYSVHSLVDFNMHLPANALLIAFVFGLLANPGTTSESEIAQDLRATPRLRFALILFAAIFLWQCLRLYPGEHYAAQAREALENEDPVKAIALANKALGYERKNPNIFFYLGRALGALGNSESAADQRVAYYEKALAAVQSAHRLSPLDATYLLDAAYLYDEMGRFAEGEWMYYLARARDPRSVAVDRLYKTHLRAWRKSSN